MRRAYLVAAVLAAVLPAARGEEKAKEDPAASKLLADARAARAQWTGFPGFTADVELNVDGKVTRGSVQVSDKGRVEVKLDDPGAVAWVRREIGSIAGHRLDNSAGLGTPCAFMDDNANHPLGRAVRVLNDELHSSYRIRDRQIIEVNRQMQDARFTITVLENRLNEEKTFLPACYVVNTWDLKSETMRSSTTFHHTWQRVGKYDLPASVMVVTATPATASSNGTPARGKLEARTLKLSNHKLTSP
jgi:hypothetical protein